MAAYCLLHNYYIRKNKLYTKCRADKPCSNGLSYKQTGKDSSKYKCRYLIFLDDCIKEELNVN